MVASERARQHIQAPELVISISANSDCTGRLGGEVMRHEAMVLSDRQMQLRISFPLDQLFHQIEELRIEANEPLDHTKCVLHLVRIVWGEDDAQGRLGRAFQHVLPFLIEAKGDRIPLLEDQ